MKKRNWSILLTSLIAAVLIILTTTQYASAAPIKDVPVTVTQPDGVVLNIFATGDEYYNWLHDSDGFTIIQDSESGYYVYAQLINDTLEPTELIVGVADPGRSGLTPFINLPAEKILEIRQSSIEEFSRGDRNISRAPTQGTINNLVIFIRFSDEIEFTESPTVYTDMLNNTTPGSNSLINYFKEVSYNALTINSQLFPTPLATIRSYQDIHPRNYYQPYNAVTNPDGYLDFTARMVREQTLLRDAINYIKGLGQFPNGASIDSDNDGYVDSMTFIVSGGADGWNDLLWPHAWSLFYYDVTIDGKVVNTFNLQLRDWVHNGVLAHEMFHVLGGPDLYHYSSNGIQPVGGWDVMEAVANPPQHMGCFMKYKYGKWIDNIPTITAVDDYTLNPVTSSSNNCYRVNSPNSMSEYFILEYRSESSSFFENSLPGSGLLVYRINTLAGNGNAGGPPDEVYIFRPDGTLTVNGNINTANFSSNVGRTEINNLTNPSPFLSNGNPGGLDICNIGASNETISFRLCTEITTNYGTVFLPLVVKNHNSNVFNLRPSISGPEVGAFVDTLIPQLTWRPAPNLDPWTWFNYWIYEAPSFDLVQSGWAEADAGALILGENLKESTNYYWYAAYDYYDQSANRWYMGPYTSWFSFTTGSGYTTPGTPSLISPSDGAYFSNESILLNWSSVSGANNYQIRMSLGFCDFQCYDEFFTTSTSLYPWFYSNLEHRWKVRAGNGYKWGAWSEEWSFTTGYYSSSLAPEGAMGFDRLFIQGDDGQIGFDKQFAEGQDYRFAPMPEPPFTD